MSALHWLWGHFGEMVALFILILLAIFGGTGPKANGDNGPPR